MEEILNAIAGNWIFIVSTVGAVMLLYWAYDARDDADDVVEVVEEVGDRTADAIGLGFGATLSLTVVATSVLTGIGMQVSMVSGHFANLAADAPLVATDLIVTAVGAAGLAGLINLSPLVFVAVGVGGLLLAYGIRD